jgi:hypothetical protein
MVHAVILVASGDVRTVKVADVSAAGIAKALRKTKAPERLGTYPYDEDTLTFWGWKEGTAENKHDLPIVTTTLFGDVIVTGTGDFTEGDWAGVFEEAEMDADAEDEVDAGADADADADADAGADEVDADDAEADEVDAEEEDVEDAEEVEEVEEEVEEDGDCYDEGDENGGGAKRRVNRRRTVTSEYRRMDMGLKARIKLPGTPGKRAPRWQSAPELEEE